VKIPKPSSVTILTIFNVELKIVTARRTSLKIVTPDVLHLSLSFIRENERENA